MTTMSAVGGWVGGWGGRKDEASAKGVCTISTPSPPFPLARQYITAYAKKNVCKTCGWVMGGGGAGWGGAGRWLSGFWFIDAHILSRCAGRGERAKRVCMRVCLSARERARALVKSVNGGYAVVGGFINRLSQFS